MIIIQNAQESVMHSYQALLNEIALLESRQVEIAKQGRVLVDCWIERTAAGGTARGKGNELGRYATLRSRKVELQPGRKFKYIPIAEIGSYEEAIARGREQKQVEKRLKILRDRLNKVERLLAK
jgi:hypothetical protein